MNKPQVYILSISKQNRYIHSLTPCLAAECAQLQDLDIFHLALLSHTYVAHSPLIFFQRWFLSL